MFISEYNPYNLSRMMDPTKDHCIVTVCLKKGNVNHRHLGEKIKKRQRKKGENVKEKVRKEELKMEK
jgi:hypothetical protein